MCGINVPAGRPAAGETVNWACPEGHRESDDAPLPARPFCLACDRDYEQDEITVRNSARPAAAPAREVSYAGA